MSRPEIAATVPVPLDQESVPGPRLSEVAARDLKRRTAHGALVSTGAQVATILLRTGSMMILARLLLKEEFGVVNMVTAFTGFLGLFRDAGLSMASVQRNSITDAQTSTLFWVNLLVGGLLAGTAAVAAPLLALFYHEPRLLWVTVALGTSFLFNGAGAQHRAMLQRQMRFPALAGIDIVSLVVGTAAGIAAAAGGYGYWALVVMTVMQPAVSMITLWFVTRWVPGKPQRGSGIRSMLMFGGTVTLNNVLVYFAYNLDKVLLGKFWGAEALGVYGRAYQLINLPTENLNSTIGLVAFPALSRIQNDPARLASYFLNGYRLFLTLVIPLTMGCALFADDIIRVFLGPNWRDATGVFRLLAPTILTFALVNPFAWLMLASGRAGRSLRIALMIAPVVVLGYLFGLKHGPHGVAAGFSGAMVLLVVPVIAWAKHGTHISTHNILRSILPPFVSILVGAATVWFARHLLSAIHPAFLRLVVETSVLFGAYLLTLLFVMGQKTAYSNLIRETGFWPLAKNNR